MSEENRELIENLQPDPDVDLVERAFFYTDREDAVRDVGLSAAILETE